MVHLAGDHPSTRIFDTMRDWLEEHPEDGQKSIAEIGGIFAFKLLGDEGGEWYVDLKETGTVGKGLAPQGKAYDVLFELDVSDFEQLADEETDEVSSQLTSSGRMTVSGKTGLAVHLDKVFELGRNVPSFGTLSPTR
ncbi:hypothetical protein CB0940_09015 [Cercospora beticola]|uniref:SCP2 domain-containing protein n=1 Tax=Cercospora beticola TaxID=122368 RepID=A0A2G5HHS9_CERBT|nr:hypothetical protein CB0940_09015 [Cercospora beticola]PIA92124.1 hypothetical protein CB0940_09015 [Cercospora beticola]WPB06713.1 hypothetical protein RHO25_011372 [Cercospora beticola]